MKTITEFKGYRFSVDYDPAERRFFSRTEMPTFGYDAAGAEQVETPPLDEADGPAATG